jgi:hypothetical protein
VQLFAEGIDVAGSVEYEEYQHGNRNQHEYTDSYLPEADTRF